VQSVRDAVTFSMMGENAIAQVVGIKSVLWGILGQHVREKLK
jgi:hypothetical protein